MNKLSLVSLAAIAACSGAPVIKQSAQTAPEADPKTEAEVATALETAKLIRDKCIGLLPDGGTSFSVQEDGGKVTTTLGITKGSHNGDTITEETCECIYRIDIPTFVHEKTSCEYSYDTRELKDGELEREQTGSNTVKHIEKPDGKHFTSLYTTTTYETDRELPTVKSRLTTEISADGSGCKTTTDDTSNIRKMEANGWDKIPYDPAKLGSCEYFANESSIFMSEVKDAICEQLQKEGVKDDLPPLCARQKVYAPK